MAFYIYDPERRQYTVSPLPPPVRRGASPEQEAARAYLTGQLQRLREIATRTAAAPPGPSDIYGVRQYQLNQLTPRIRELESYLSAPSESLTGLMAQLQADQASRKVVNLPTFEPRPSPVAPAAVEQDVLRRILGQPTQQSRDEAERKAKLQEAITLQQLANQQAMAQAEAERRRALELETLRQLGSKELEEMRLGQRREEVSTEADLRRKQLEAQVQESMKRLGLESEKLKAQEREGALEREAAMKRLEREYELKGGGERSLRDLTQLTDSLVKLVEEGYVGMPTETGEREPGTVMTTEELRNILMEVLKHLGVRVGSNVSEEASLRDLERQIYSAYPWMR